VGIKGDDIAFGNTSDYQEHNHRGPLERGFRLSDFTPFQPKDFSEFKRIFTQFQEYSLSHTQGGPYGYNEGVLLVQKGGEVISQIERDSTNGLGHNCYGFTPDGMILSGGSNGFLKAYNTAGDEIADFIGHAGEVWAIASDGDRLIFGGDDMVIHVWDLNKLKQGQTKISPSFSLFVSNDDQWVVWTPEGFFNASQDGTKYIGYHINRGKENPAEYITVDQLYDLYYRPDLVAKRIQGGHETEISEALSRIGDIDEILKSGLPPVLEMVSAPAGEITNRDLTLKVKLTDRGGGIGKIIFRVNGVEYGMPQGARPTGFIGMKSSGVIIIPKDLTLKNGENIITATAYNKDGKIESKPAELVLSVDDPRNYEPDFYGLCIGITQYRDYSLNLKYAAKDALDMKTELETRAAPLFKNVQVMSLTDREASAAGIRAAFEALSPKIRPNDVFVLYMSGHGKVLDAQYHFIPWDMRYENEESLRQQSLSHEKIQELMAMIPAQKSLMIFDTCYSGSVALASSKGMEEKTAIDRLMRATGRATLAATSDTSLAYEGHKNHGIFTYALLEGLRVHADRKGNRDGTTGIDELANFVQDEVPRITFDKFGFEQIPMRSVKGNAFPIGCCEGYNGAGCKP
jgi:hypothetical protein